MKQYLNEIDRIADGGLNTDDFDTLLCQKLALLVRGEIVLRTCEANEEPS